MSQALRRLATLTASTKRTPALSSGKRGAPVAYLSGLLCTPLDPVDPETRQRLQLDTPHELKQTFVRGMVDIVEGDLLVVAAVEYPVRAVAEWAASTRGGDAYLHLTLEVLK